MAAAPQDALVRAVRGHPDEHPGAGGPRNDGPHGGGGHNHAVNADADVKYLRIALALIVGFMAVEVVVAVFVNSLASFSDAGRMLSDAGALAAPL